MVTHAIRENEGERMAVAYGRNVLSALRTTQGCVFASHLQNTANPQECISLTIWDSAKESNDYEASGLYEQLVDSLRPFFVESNEWKLELSKDLSLEYTPIQVEPTIERFHQSVAGSEQISRLKAKPFAVQMITLSVQEEQVDAFERIFASEIHPKFKLHKGFIDLILLRKEREFHILSFWDETVDLESSRSPQSVHQLLESIYTVLPDFVRWRMTHQSAAQTSASTEDIKSAIYRCLVAEWFPR
jgi:heme-degrading monooxygenase HmoA